MVMSQIKEQDLAAAGADKEDGRRPTIVSAPAAASPELWTVPVAAHSRRKTSCASLRRSTALRASPERSARSCAARGFTRQRCRTGGVSTRRRLRSAKPRQARPQNRRTKPAGGGLALSRRENLRLKQRLERAETIIELQKNRRGTQPPAG